jgi:hypothetical protein
MSFGGSGARFFRNSRPIRTPKAMRSGIPIPKPTPRPILAAEFRLPSPDPELCDDAEDEFCCDVGDIDEDAEVIIDDEEADAVEDDVVAFVMLK